jgi:type IX secretion system PorP/SprF family membrane protein
VKVSFITILILLSVKTSFSQKAPLQSQYMFNSVALNPAFTGNEGVFSIIGSYRSQWVGFPGAPQTEFLTAHAPLKDLKSAFGLQVYADKIGAENNNGVFGSYSYKLKLNRSSNLVFGIAGGVNFYTSYENSLISTDNNDDIINNNVINYTAPDFSFGMHYFTKRLFINLSIPNFLSQNYENNKIRLVNDFNRYNLLLGGGYLITFKNSKVELKPSFLLRYHYQNPIQFDINLMAKVHKNFSFGFSYRYIESIILLLKVKITNQLSFMYSYGMPLTTINKVSYGSHEISLKYNFLFKKSNVANPRFLGW